MRLPFQQSLDFHQGQTLIDWPYNIPIDEDFPEDSANKLAAMESFNKHLFRPNTYLHKWWARRSGTTFRYILKQLVDNPAKRDFYEGGGLEGKIIFDPMMGGGNTLHEAIRMGANVIGMDIDPIPVLQARASLNHCSIKQKKDIFKEFREVLIKKLSNFYITDCPNCMSKSEIQFILYGLRKRCLCGEAIIIDSLLLRKDHAGEIRICPDCHAVYSFEKHTCMKKLDIPLVEKKEKRCGKCNTLFSDILTEPFPSRYLPLVIVGLCPEHGSFFKPVTTEDIARIDQAHMEAKKIDFGDPQRFAVPQGPKSKDLIRRGVKNYIDLFTPRQLIYLKNASDFISELSFDDRQWLSLLVSTSLEFNSLLCGYKGGDIRRPGAIRHVFSHHAYSFPYTALENNPVFSGNSSGTLNRLFNDRIVKAARWAVGPLETRLSETRNVKVQIKGEIDAGEKARSWDDLKDGKRKFIILQCDAASAEIRKEIADYIVTDPPYYDSVQYSDLSNFFRVWLSRFLPDDADWHYNPLDSAVCEDNYSDTGKYGTVLGKIWKTCNHALNKEHGRLIFTFHHWRPEAWAELTLSLKKADFLLVNRYVVFSENPISVHINGLNSLKHDTILVLRPAVTSGEEKEWVKPSIIDTKDSYNFCRNCGDALGWFLGSNLTKHEIQMGWKQMVEGNENGKIPG